MTKKRLRQTVVSVIATYAVAILVGFVLNLGTPVFGPTLYDTYRDMLFLILAIPAALLSYAFQQRSSYLASLRGLWSKLVESVNAAIQYTYDEHTTQHQHAEIMTQLAIAIDEVRGVYCNVGERAGSVGLYPYEPVKQIYGLIHDLGYGDLDATQRKHTRNQIVAHWQSIRFAFLSEFDRAEPSTPIVEPHSI